MSAEEIILGMTLPSKSAPMYNFISIFTKAFIHRQKLFHNGELGFISWLGELKKKLQVEELICRSEGKIARFAKWEIVLQALG